MKQKNKTPFKLITQPDELQNLCDHLLNDEPEDFICIDTEFMRRTTYWPILCLIQVGGTHVQAIIDPLQENLDLTPFFDVLMSPKLIKVFHSARQDLEIFYHLMGKVPAPLFDTQVAAMVCGYGDSVGYGNLVEEVVKVRLDKSQRFTDWAKRPLHTNQLEYAILDVVYLRDIYLHLSKKLEQENRSSWIQTEMDFLSNPKIYVTDPQEAWRKIKARSNEPRFLANVQALAAARENVAMETDQAKTRIASDQVILEIAAQPILDAKALKAKGRLSLSSKTAEAFVEALKRAAELPDDQCPTVKVKRRKSKNVALIDLLKVWLKQVSSEHNVAEKLIASAADLEALTVDLNADIPALKGWRYDVFGKTAQMLIKGEKAVKCDGRKLVLV